MDRKSPSEALDDGAFDGLGVGVGIAIVRGATVFGRNAKSAPGLCGSGIIEAGRKGENDEGESGGDGCRKHGFSARWSRSGGKL